MGSCGFLPRSNARLLLLPSSSSCVFMSNLSRSIFYCASQTNVAVVVAVLVNMQQNIYDLWQSQEQKQQKITFKATTHHSSIRLVWLTAVFNIFKSFPLPSLLKYFPYFPIKTEDSKGKIEGEKM